MKWIPVYGWGGFIFALSSIPNFNPPHPKIQGIDKLAHLGEYLILTSLVFSRRGKRKFTNLLPLILVFALLDEFHQKFIPGREVELADLFMNFAGILCGWLSMEGKMRIFKKAPRAPSEFDLIYEKINDLNKRVRRIEWELRKKRLQDTRKEDIRVGVFVDVQNMFYATKKQYEARLDYVKLLQHILKGRRLIKAIAYVIENPEIDQSGFFSLLAHHSFAIQKKPLIQRADGSQKGDWDMEIALDILNMVDQLDVVALVSGDGDFVSLVESVKAKGPKVEVYSFPQNTALELKESADEFIPLGEDLLFR